jgi:RimJ/RimL family protein N-acetyltransferase
MAHPHWPLFDLRIHTANLELRPPSDDDAEALAELAAGGIHDPATMPFGVPWTDAPPGDLQRSALQHYWKIRAEWTKDSWALDFAVVCRRGRREEIVGAQGVFAKSFPVLRTVSTGSWLGKAFQGKGMGTEMRAAVLHFAFTGLGALRAESGAFDDNAASRGVSRALGYVENGEHAHLRRDQPARMIDLLLTHERWKEHCWPEPIEVVGLAPCLPMFGLGDVG